MNDSTFNALISLLDDPDPHVYQEVEEQLFTLGASGIEKLERAWEQCSTNQIIQSRLEELISRIQITSYTEQLMEWRKAGGNDLLEGWIILTCCQYPTLNKQKYRNEVQRLVAKIWLQMDPRMNEIERLCVINKHFYTVERFTGNYQDPDKPDNIFLSHLIDTRQGNSLSLSALYLIVCQQLDIPLQVVNFMGYYAIRCYRRNVHFYIDAYNQGMFFTPQQVQEFLQKLNVESNVSYYKPLSNIYIILNMVHTLISQYRTVGLEAKAQKFEQLLQDIEIKFD
jgi:regulator of sirC expression with transglutaminase-like and TPR domain